jgi:hypothetical protein
MSTDIPDTGTKGSKRTAILIFLLQVILPVVLAFAGLFGILYGLAYLNLNFWLLDRTLTLIICAVVVLGLSIAFTLALDSLSMRTRPKPKTGAERARLYRSRLVKMVLGALIIPAGVFAAASMVPLPGGGTALLVLGQYSSTPLLPKTTSVMVLGDRILQSSNISTRLQGIKTLQVLQTPDALTQLFRIIQDDPAALKDAVEYQALSQAVAAYGTGAKSKLFELFNETAPESGTAVTLQEADLYDRYFAASLDALRQEIRDSNPDAAIRDAKLAQVDASAADLKTALGKMPGGPGESATVADSSLHAFILQTFRLMELKDDVDILAFAHKTAANTAFPDSIRGQALLLVAKFGGKNDMDSLYPYVQYSNEILATRAMEAITLLTEKITGAKSTP